MPIIAISGVEKSSTYLVMAKQLGANETFQKPVDRKVLETYIQGLFPG